MEEVYSCRYEDVIIFRLCFRTRIIQSIVLLACCYCCCRRIIFKYFIMTKCGVSVHLLQSHVSMFLDRPPISHRDDFHFLVGLYI